MNKQMDNLILDEDKEMNALLDQLKNVQSSAEDALSVEDVMIAGAAPPVNKPVQLPFSIELLNEGRGQTVPEGATVTVHYEGRLVNPDGTDGKMFDSSLARHKPFTFTLGEGAVISGWEYGITSLKKGQTALITIPPDLAYGSTGYQNMIPPNATLRFEITIVNF